VVELPALDDSVGLAGAFAGVIGDLLLAGGGANFPDGIMPWDGGKKVWHDTLRQLDLAEPETGWKTIGRLPKPNAYGVSLTTPEGVVLLGGGDADGHFREVWLLLLGPDGQPDFRELPELPLAMAQMSGALVGRRIHLCGGIENPSATVATNSHWMLDLDEPDEGWREMPALPAPGRILAMAAALDGEFFLMGGCSLSPDEAGNARRTLLNDAWKYSRGRWSRIADIPTPLAAAGSPAPVARESVFLVSGDDGSQVGLPTPAAHPGFSKNVLRYDTRANHWASAGELAVPPPVTLPVASRDGEFIFFNGEIKPGVRTPQVFMFCPSSCAPPGR
jgi:N-acetylneuraminic acid mutarotase